MKKFKFRYQTLLEVRERRKKAEEEKLQVLTAAVQAEEAELARIQGEEAAQRQAWMTMQLEGALDLQQMVLYQDYFARMELRQKAQQGRIDEARARVLNQRDMLVAAHRELEAIEMLKERDQKAWQSAIDKAENELLDELATIRYARRDGGAPGAEGPA
jgi:flagellar FliJ protein